ncbi:MAG: 50S ribosome-binding GTPase [Selenomonadaceae bacterium]|nr:50S ribosome-binding GTPase [Selenomonadaceae bacterium]
MNYIASTVEDFFVKLDKMQNDLAQFSQNLDNRSEKIPALLQNFEREIFSEVNTQRKNPTNAVEKAAQKSIDNLRAIIKTWSEKIEADRKGKQFIKKNEKYLVVMVFGAVKAGKSSLGNFFAGKKFFNAPFDNHYKKISKPIFETEESGRNTGDIEKDSRGDTWFQEGVIDTTGAIQYFTLSGLRWIDSPGTGAVGKVGDTKNMTALVEEYLSYTDMCIFLMNSSEPGLQDDMRYISKLNKEGQEALIVITKSDFSDEDEDDEGNIISVIAPKTSEIRKLQEDDICRRVKESYPEVDANKFRAISISTLLAGEAVEDSDDKKFRDSNLDKLMKILGDKVSDNAIARKQENPRRLLNGFVDTVVEDLQKFVRDLADMTIAIEKYKSDMDRVAALIVTNVKREVRTEISALAGTWNNQVKRGQKISNETINAAVSKILQEKLNEEINAQMRRVIEDFQNAEMQTVKANISAAALEKKTAQIAHTYNESYTVSREPRGIIEHIRSFFGKEYYDTETSTRTEYQTIELGTNLDEFLESLMPQVESYAKTQADENLVRLRDGYFVEREKFADKMKVEIQKLRGELLRLKF